MRSLGKEPIKYNSVLVLFQKNHIQSEPILSSTINFFKEITKQCKELVISSCVISRLHFSSTRFIIKENTYNDFNKSVPIIYRGIA